MSEKVKINHIDGTYDSTDSGVKRVKSFLISEDAQREEYEELINNKEAVIEKEQNNFDKVGRLTITV